MTPKGQYDDSEKITHAMLAEDFWSRRSVALITTNSCNIRGYLGYNSVVLRWLQTGHGRELKETTGARQATIVTAREPETNKSPSYHIVLSMLN